MKTAYAVIGAGYGDEGKGLITDYLVRHFANLPGKWPPLNVRFNGGGQAGHTVVSGDKRHIFSHVGAGTFAGAHTYLPRNFIINPFILTNELAQLQTLHVHPSIEAHPDCLVTTGFDMVINWLRELQRGQGRHGSCGVGINETVTRSERGYRLTLDDLYGMGLTKKLYDIYDAWWSPLLKELNDGSPEAQELIDNLDFTNELEAMQHAPSLFKAVGHRPATSYVSNHDIVVLEGAQGLGLDEFLGKFPHVTRSVTGLPSALLAAYELGVTEVTPIYVTRCYQTRHGAGPLLHEGEPITKKELRDQTNVTGRWQGQLRYAPLNVQQLEDNIVADLSRSKKLADFLRVKIRPHQLAVTCLDQVDDDVRFYYNYFSDGFTTGKHVLLAHLSSRFHFHSHSYGPTADHVKVG